GDQIDHVGLTDFLEGPAQADVADEATGELGNPAEGGNNWNHVSVPFSVCRKVRREVALRAALRLVVRRPRKLPHQLLERPGPTRSVAVTGCLGPQTRVGEGEFRSGIDRPQVDFDPRLFARFLRLAAICPTPAHDQTGGFDDFDVLARALMLAAV